MAKQIEPHLSNIGEFLKLEGDAKFVIPQYQRSYSWNIDKCDNLWSDIVDFLNNDSKDPYFFGTIIVSSSNDDKELSLIDGQQRTTTFLILLKVLLIKINNTLKEMVNDPESESLRSALRDRRKEIINILYKVDTDNISDKPDDISDKKTYETFGHLVNNSDQELYKDELTNIMVALDYNDAESKSYKIPYKQKDNKYTNFFKNFKNFYFKEELKKTEFLNKFTKTLLNECQVIEIKSWKVEQAIKMFNSLNSDGMPLTDADIIYSEMFEATDENDRETLSKKWRYLINLTNKLEEDKIISISALLNQKMYLYRSLNGETKNTAGNIDVTTPGLQRYYTGDGFGKKLINNSLKFCEELIILAQIWNIVKDNAVMKVLFKFNDNSKLFLGSFFHRYDSYFSFDENGIIEYDVEKINTMIDDTEKVVELMLKLFTVLSLVDAGYSSSSFKTFLFSEEIKLADSNITLDEIKDDFAKHINKQWTKEEIKSKLLDYEKNDIVYLNEYLFAKNNGKKFNISSNVDIEHIMPQSGNRNANSIQKDANIENDEMFLEYINKLGNKILLEYSINRSLGNEWFRTKVSTNISDKTGYIDSSYPLAQYLVQLYSTQTKPYWTKDDIDTATEEASERIANFIFEK